MIQMQLLVQQLVQLALSHMGWIDEGPPDHGTAYGCAESKHHSQNEWRAPVHRTSPSRVEGAS
jgi:hypothetical protein